MAEISLILPTRERPELVKRMLSSVFETAASPSSLEIILYTDEDDPTAPIEFQGLNLVRLTGQTKSMGEITQACYQKSTGRLIMLVNDDLIFRTKAWDVMIRKEGEHFLDEIVLLYPNDGYYGKKLSTFPILTRRCCELLGKIVPAIYQSHCIDSHIFDIFVRLDKLGYARRRYLRKITLEHKQYGASKNDDADRRIYHSLGGEREKSAQLLFEVVEAHKHLTLHSTSLLIYNADEHSLNLAAALLREDRKRGLIREVTLVPPRGNLFYSGHSLSNPPPSRGRENDIEGRLPEEGLLQVPQRFGKKVRISAQRGDQSLACQLNEAVRQVKGNFLLFLDGSSLPEERWLEALLKGIQGKETGAVGSLWINPRNGKVENAGIVFVGNQNKIQSSFLYRGLSVDHPVIGRARKLEAVGLSGMIVRKEIFETLGGFSDQCPGMEAIDFCLRLREKGYRVSLESRARLRHCEPWEMEERQLSHNWKGRIAPDLLKILSEDNFLVTL